MQRSEIDRRRWSRSAWVVAVAAAAWLVAPRAAPAQDSRWIVRGELMYMIAAGGDEAGCPDRTPEVPGEITEDTFNQEIGDGPGAALGIEYFVSDHIGVELAGVFGAFEGEFTIDTPIARETDSGDIDFSAVTLGANYHFRPKKRVDYYAGLFFTIFEYDTLVLQYPQNGITVNWTFGGREGTTKSDTGFGWRGGIDVPFTKDSPWVFVAGVRSFRGPNDVHPIDVSVGVGRRF
jgi:hypothetical protein